MEASRAAVEEAPSSVGEIPDPSVFKTRLVRGDVVLIVTISDRR
jgi:hypothetical protein